MWQCASCMRSGADIVAVCQLYAVRCRHCGSVPAVWGPVQTLWQCASCMRSGADMVTVCQLYAVRCRQCDSCMRSGADIVTVCQLYAVRCRHCDSVPAVCGPVQIWQRCFVFLKGTASLSWPAEGLFVCQAWLLHAISCKIEETYFDCCLSQILPGCCPKTQRLRYTEL
jgi:hypothetical protein